MLTLGGSLGGHDLGAGARKDGAGLGGALLSAGAECEELVEGVGLEEASLPWVLEHPVGQKLLEDLPAEQKHIKTSN